jgi:3',5'-cyclic AMP phosphodiesterase CpdA
MFRFHQVFVIILLIWSCEPETDIPASELKVAFMADIHFADVYPEADSFMKSQLPVNDKDRALLVRSMQAQLHSTRLFNENYFALIAALEDAIRKGVKLIAIPGDFSDDGQPVHIKGLSKIMDRYTLEHGVRFFMINGNHDPTRPFGKDGGKRDFLGINGKAQPIMGKKGKYFSNIETENETLIWPDLNEWGYKEILGELRDHGFFPNENYRYWETPFSSYSYDTYELEKAKDAARLENRTYLGSKSKFALPDVSYLVEPEPGLWLLALDANVYIPKTDGVGFSGSGIGYNQVLKHKQYLVDWTANVVQEAKRLGKTLIAFSHYPMLDFNDGASEEMKQLFGKNAFQAYRIPDRQVGEAFADSGLKIHVGGHMHINDTGILATKKGNTLVNVQAPSLAAYPPGYKIITVKNHSKVRVETVVLDTVPNFDSFFAWYKKELNFMQAHLSESSWNGNILASKSYLEFTNFHLQELVRLRFLTDDWPTALQEDLLNQSGWSLLLKSSAADSNVSDLNSLKLKEENLLKTLNLNHLSPRDFKSWNGQDLILDFYRFRNADQLALEHISASRVKAYRLLLNQLLDTPDDGSLASLKQFAIIFQKQMAGENAVNFELDLENIRTN